MFLAPLHQLRAPSRRGRKEENGNVDGPGSVFPRPWCDPWTLVMEGTGELQLDAKAEVSFGLQGAGASRFLEQERLFPKLCFTVPFQVTNQVSEWQPRPVLSRPALVKGRAAGPGPPSASGSRGTIPP